MHTGIAAHFHVEPGVTDHHSLVRIGTGLAQRVQHHARMRLAGTAIDCLQCVEIAVQIVMAEDDIQPAPCLAGGNTHQPAFIGHAFDGLAGASIEGFFKIRLGALFDKGFLVEGRQLRHAIMAIIGRRKPGDCLAEFQPDNCPCLFIGDRRQSGAGKGPFHGALDDLAAVHNGAVNVPDREFQRCGHGGSPGGDTGRSAR